jgi:Reverse transcriptase (RNA-dependent DNA polymerase)
MILQIERAEDSTIAWYKARRVVRGFEQQEGVDFLKTISPTINKTTLLTCLALSAVDRWNLYQLNFKTAFLHGQMDRDIFINLPDHSEGDNKHQE